MRRIALDARFADFDLHDLVPGKDKMCVRCRDWEKRDFERPPCVTGECAYRHLGYADPVEIAIADIRNALRSRGVMER